ncbi:nuclear transport factor 2 family protein [Nocardia sp. NPDC052566]|uniref:nuclear transport factor 2 family protein n=1 Tax=Nocardia sp. NPDC052566 TaxID=3364330 RepID=UPI0037C846F5
MATIEVEQVVLRERQARDRGWWDRMGECFAVDSRVRLSWFDGSGADFVTGSRRMAAGGTASRHRNSPPVAEVRGDRAVVELPTAIEIRTEIDGVEVDLTSYARLVYRVERRGGRWLIVSLDAVYERDTMVPTVPGTVWPGAATAFARFRPSYRMLAYLVETMGYPLDPDLYGDDRPEVTAGFYRELFGWLAVPESELIAR